MRQSSIARALNLHHQGEKLCGLPTPGSKIRIIYDHLTSHPGEWTTLPVIPGKTTMTQLRDFYGLVTHCRHNGSHRRVEHLLEGEYMPNGVYVSYLKESDK